MDFKELANSAIKAAKAAGAVIRNAAKDNVAVDHKDGGTNYASQVVTEIDRECDGIIREILKPISEKYDIAFLTEELPDDGSRLKKDCFWCVDPLDGTLAFIRKEPGYAVSIALVSKEGIPLIGVVYNPTSDLLYHAIKGSGVFRNNQSWQPRSTDNKVLSFISDKLLHEIPNAEQIRAKIDIQVNDYQLLVKKECFGGGAVWNAIRVIEEAPACMIKTPKEEKGGGSLWDYAATTCIFNELELQATNFHGGPLDLNKASDTYMNHEGVFFSSVELSR
ncbi:MAG: inositol monophosphatase [Flavobacteriaceae bacterium]|nr:inositol monophosphatase [Flavobacteriaceae bacterium]